MIKSNPLNAVQISALIDRQKIYAHAARLEQLTASDPATWAAISAPLECLNGDESFFQYLDEEHSGRITPGKIVRTIVWLQSVLVSLKTIDGKTVISPSELKPDTGDGAELVAAIEELQPEGTKDAAVGLEQVKDRLDALRHDVLIGDGIIVPAAISDPASKELTEELIAAGFCTTSADGTRIGITADDLDRFIAAVNEVGQWQERGESDTLLCRGRQTAADYRLISELTPKVEEYFNYCDLLVIDPVNADRFNASPETMPALELNDPKAVTDFLVQAPLAPPRSSATLDAAEDRLNPVYRERIIELAAIVGHPQITRADWRQLLKDFAAYRRYQDECPAPQLAPLEADRLRRYLAPATWTELRAAMEADCRISDRLLRLSMLEKLLLCRRDLMRLSNNFVSFCELLTPGANSLLQSGDLLLDGRRFHLVIPVTDPPAHRKIAGRSYIAVIYLKLVRPGEKIRFAASAVTAGQTRNLYMGKHGVFTGVDGREWDAEIIDLIIEPVSFTEALWLPFRRLGEIVNGKMEKFTNAKIKELDTDLDRSLTGKPAPPPPPNQNAALLLGGGIGVAAMGSSLALILNVIKSTSWLKILFYVIALLLLFALPLTLSAIGKLRRRNLALFLEASGWAINPQLRLTRELGRFFTRTPSLQDKKSAAKSAEARAFRLRLLIYVAVTIILLSLLAWQWSK